MCKIFEHAAQWFVKSPLAEKIVFLHKLDFCRLKRYNKVMKNLNKNTSVIINYIPFFLCLIITIGCGLMLLVPIKQFSYNNVQYSDLLYKTYTFESYEYISSLKRGTHYDIKVREESIPLRIFVYTDEEVNKNNLNNLRTGDTINCYVRDSKNCYDVVEMSYGDNTIISLQDYKNAREKNVIAGFVIIPVLTAMMAGISIFVFIKGYKACAKR